MNALQDQLDKQLDLLQTKLVQSAHVWDSEDCTEELMPEVNTHKSLEADEGQDRTEAATPLLHSCSVRPESRRRKQPPSPTVHRREPVAAIFEIHLFGKLRMANGCVI